MLSPLSGTPCHHSFLVPVNNGSGGNNAPTLNMCDIHTEGKLGEALRDLLGNSQSGEICIGEEKFTVTQANKDAEIMIHGQDGFVDLSIFRKKLLRAGGETYTITPLSTRPETPSSALVHSFSPSQEQVPPTTPCDVESRMKALQEKMIPSDPTLNSLKVDVYASWGIVGILSMRLFQSESSDDFNTARETYLDPNINALAIADIKAMNDVYEDFKKQCKDANADASLDALMEYLQKGAPKELCSEFMAHCDSTKNPREIFEEFKAYLAKNPDKKIAAEAMLLMLHKLTIEKDKVKHSRAAQTVNWLRDTAFGTFRLLNAGVTQADKYLLKSTLLAAVQGIVGKVLLFVGPLLHWIQGVFGAAQNQRAISIYTRQIEHLKIIKKELEFKLAGCTADSIDTYATNAATLKSCIQLCDQGIKHATQKIENTKPMVRKGLVAIAFGTVATILTIASLVTGGTILPLVILALSLVYTAYILLYVNKDIVAVEEREMYLANFLRTQAEGKEDRQDVIKNTLKEIKAIEKDLPWYHLFQHWKLGRMQRAFEKESEIINEYVEKVTNGIVHEKEKNPKEAQENALMTNNRFVNINNVARILRSGDQEALKFLRHTLEVMNVPKRQIEAMKMLCRAQKSEDPDDRILNVETWLEQIFYGDGLGDFTDEENERFNSLLRQLEGAVIAS